MKKTTVFIVDDHRMLRESIMLYANMHPKFEVVGDADTGEAAVERVAVLKPDVVLMDVHLPGINGIEATRKIKALGLPVRVIALTMYNESDAYLTEMLQAGAMGYILKSSGMEEIAAAIDMVMKGKYYLAKEMLPYFTTGEAPQITRPRVEEDRSGVKLTRRELEVLQLTSEGHTTQEIAKRLAITVRTVENHRYKMCQKTQQKNMASLVRYAFENNLLKSSH